MRSGEMIMNGKMRRIRHETAVSGKCSERLKKTMKNLSYVAGLPAKIRTGDLSNAEQE
jgi:hypothetical protein